MRNLHLISIYARLHWNSINLVQCFGTMDSPHRTAIRLLLVTAFLSLACLVKCQQQNPYLTVGSQDLIVIVEESEPFTLQLNGAISKSVKIFLNESHDGLIDIIPKEVVFNTTITKVHGIIKGVSPGHVEITAQPNTTEVTNSFIRVLVANSRDLITFSNVIGWFYFVAWSVSFYPQIYTNFRRNSVIGLNFDFLSLNMVGFILYGVFNIGLYSIPEIKEEYSRLHPRGLNPVHLNDVFFAVHATIATLITIVQCFCYERGDQRVSVFGKSLLTIFAGVIILTTILSLTEVIHWLNFLYICSYVKLSITLIKYVPQAYMNYQRKSTIGWSIGNVLLDFTGGMLSMLQMMLNAYNYDDWISIMGDPTKFGLGLFSVMFDVLFLLQHYVFYREPKDKLSGHV